MLLRLPVFFRPLLPSVRVCLRSLSIYFMHCFSKYVATGKQITYTVLSATVCETNTLAILHTQEKEIIVLIRFIITVCFVILYLILTIPVLVVLWLIGLRNPSLRERGARVMIRWAFRTILKLDGVRITAIGQERIPKDQAVLYIGNHRSFFDILLTYTLVPGLTGYVAKKELSKFPVFRVWMEYIHCLFLDRSSVKEGLKMILAGVDKIRNGISVFIFPEGTRSNTPDELDMLEFHSGSLKMASKADCPIVPVALLNTRNIFEAHFPKIRKTHVVIEFGEPIVLSDLDPQDRKNIGPYTKNCLEAMLQKNKPMV